MLVIKDVRAKWQKTIQTTKLSKQLKTWSYLARASSNKSTTKSKPPQINISENSTVQVSRFADCPEQVQNRYLQSLVLSSKEILAARLLIDVKEHWIVQVKVKGQARLQWQPSSIAPQAIGFMLQGNGNLQLRELSSVISPNKFILLHIGSELEVNYSTATNHTSTGWQNIYHMDIARAAKLFWSGALKSSGKSAISIMSFCRGQGSSSHISFGMNLTKQASVYLTMLTEHIIPNSIGNMLVKTAGNDQSSAVIEAIIKISQKSFNTNSYLHEDSLLLSPQAKIVAIPNLEIKNRDVKASHGATIGHFDPALRFYLASRGLSIQAVEHLLLSGFFQPIGSKIKDDTIRKELSDILIFNR